MTGRVLFHVQYLLGIGHLQRSWRIGQALARAGFDVTMVCGGEPVPALTREQPGLRVVQLPPLKALDARFDLVDPAGKPLDDELRERRRVALLKAFAKIRPDVIVVEGFPFARRAFRFELDPLVGAARQGGLPVVCSVRDIVNVRDDPVRHREIAERVRGDFTSVLVHGDPALIRFDASFPAAPEIADRIHYTGYVYDGGPVPSSPVPRSPVGQGEVLVSGGGGPASYALLQAAVAARRLGCLAGSPWRLLTGVNLPEAQFAALAEAAPNGVLVERFRPDFRALLQIARVSVSQAGYNTALDVIAAGAPAVFVPFAAERETEQLLRAERLAKLGVAELVREDALSPETLASAIERAVAAPAAALPIDLRGAERSAELIGQMASGRSREFAPEARKSNIGQ